MRNPLAQAAERSKAAETAAPKDDQIGGFGGGLEDVERLSVVNLALWRDPARRIEIDSRIVSCNDCAQVSVEPLRERLRHLDRMSGIVGAVDPDHDPLRPRLGIDRPASDQD